MRYEKKMLILSGEGKGVVLIEKSGLGVRFALRTFGVSGAGIKAGVITPSAVFVRDLPDTPDPAAVFSLDIDSLDTLHFAVFDKRLLLYGAFGKKMWESNVMALLCSRDRPRPAPLPDLPGLPPLTTPPKTLPLPDGTGIPQSRDALYGDEALAKNDFYTPFDIASHIPALDTFLDKPRVLDPAAAPTVTLRPPREDRPEPTPTATEPDVFEVAAEQIADTEADAAIGAAAAATDVADGAARQKQPWQYAADYIRGMAAGELRHMRAEVAKPRTATAVEHIRDTSFIERCRKDIDALFGAAEKDETLAALLPDIQWVKVRFDGHTVSVGRTDMFLCYAAAGLYLKQSPLGPEAQWLPAVREAPSGKGYWLIFQDITTGRIIESC